MQRLVCPLACKDVTNLFPNYFTFDVDEWLADDKNYALIEGQNISFAEWKSPGLYWVHFCFSTSRGREAIQLTKDMFEEFCRQRPVRIAVGMIVLENKKARWLIRQVGFESLGEVDTKIGRCEMFYKKAQDDNVIQ